MPNTDTSYIKLLILKNYTKKKTIYDQWLKKFLKKELIDWWLRKHTVFSQVCSGLLFLEKSFWPFFLTIVYVAFTP